MVIFSGAILILLIVSMIFGNYYISGKAESMQQILNSVFETVHNENWEESDNLILQADKEWEKTSARFELFFFHRDLEELELLMASLKSYIAEREKTEALVHVTMLRVGIDHIAKTEKLSLENIL